MNLKLLRELFFMFQQQNYLVKIDMAYQLASKNKQLYAKAVKKIN